MMTARRPSGRNPADHADAPRRTRSVRLCGAVLVVLAAWLAVPVFFPYLATDALVSLLPGDWMAGASAGAQAAAALGHMLPYLLLGLAVYLHAASPRIHHPTAAGEPPTVETQAKCSRWLAACLVAGAISVSLSLAYFHRFVAEDAYISFRYARNLVEGAGLVYNLGERVEGYTNFLWVLMIAGGMRLGADPVGLSQALGLACFGGSLVAVYRIGMTVLPTFRWALVSTLLVGTHYSVLCFAACGLETSLQTLLLLCGCWTLVSAHRRETWRRRDAILLALLIAAGMFTRMDFALFGVVLFGGALASILRTGHPPAEETQRYVVDRVGYLLVPVVAILGGWCVWKIAYYDSILPNTFYAKRPSTGMMSPGLAYLGAFCTSYRYPLPLLVFLLGVVELARKRNILLTLALIVVVWCGYMVCIGGDFIEFRFLVPVVPLFILVLIWTATHFSWSRRFYLPVLLTVLTGYGSLHHANAFGWSQDRAEPVAQLRLQTTEALWGEAGDALREWFGEEGVVIATTAAGILPYRARLTTVDMHGLNDALIARQAPVVSNRPGHFRLARVSDLRERNVHLVIGHPKIELESVLAGWPPPRWASCVQAADRFEDDAIILGIPMETGHVLLAWYLTPHAAIDDAVATRGWPTAVVSPDGEVWRHGQ